MRTLGKEPANDAKAFANHLIELRNGVAHCCKCISDSQFDPSTGYVCNLLAPVPGPNVMPKRLSGTSCVARALPGAVHPIWITDAVLADAFRRFTHISRRHGSNVPGPLEARKRASKRRNTSLAYAGGAGPVDPAILFPKRPRDTWWRKEPEPDAMASQSILPRWLFPPPDPPPVPQLPQALELSRDGIREKYSSTQETTSEPPRPSLRSEFLQCSCVEDIHKLLAKRDIDLRQDPVTKLFIGSLLRRWTPTNIADFLTDPNLSPPGTNHHVRMMAALRNIPAQNHSPWRKLEDRKILLQALCRAVGLGLLIPKDIEGVITALAQIEISGLDEISTHPSETDMLAMAHPMLRSLQTSSILTVEDLSLDFRNDLRSKIARATPSQISLELLEILSESTSKEKDLITADTIVAWLLKVIDHKTLSTMEAIGGYLSTLTGSSLAQILLNVTETLFSMTRNHRGNIVAFEAWAEVLDSRHHSTAAESLSEYLNVERNSGAPTSQRTPIESSLMSYWLQHTLQTRRTHRTGTELLSLDFDLLCQIRSAWSSDIHPLDWLVETNQILQCLPVRNKRSVLLKLTHSLKDLLLANASSQPASLASTNHCFQACEILADDAFYEAAKRHFKHELTRFCELITSDLTQFKKNVQILIDQGDTTKLKIVSRVMKHNRVFRLGLAQYRRERQSWREVLINDNIAIVRSKPYHVNVDLFRALPPDATTQLPPAQSLLDVIDHIAVSFATNPHESAQTAYNRVRQCWRFLRGHRVPAGPVITRCLWHAGIARQGSEGTSETQVRWVAQRVRRTEGKLIARLLMSNSAFRVHRRGVIETIQKTCQATEDDKDTTSSELPKAELPLPSPQTRSAEAPQNLQRPDRLDQATVANIVDWIVQPKTRILHPAEVGALAELANLSVPRGPSEADLEEQEADLERLLKSSAQRGAEDLEEHNHLEITAIASDEGEDPYEGILEVEAEIPVRQ